jgi:hypothetical protein
MGLIGSILKQRRPKQFQFTPRYYNADAERIKQREKRMGRASPDGAQQYNISMKEAFQQRRRRVSQHSRSSALRILAITAGITILLYQFVYR